VSGMRPGGLEDRYTVPLEANRRGAHRARPNPMLGTLPVVAIAVVVIAVIAGAFVLLGSGLLPSRANSTDSSRVVGASPLPQPTNLPPGPVQATGKLPGSDITPTGTATGASQASVKLVVLNATKTTGLAKKAAASLQTKGWTVLRTGNFTGSSVSVTTVFYAQPAQAGLANQVATDLGRLQIKQSSTIAVSGITVVLGSDYKP